MNANEIKLSSSESFQSTVLESALVQKLISKKGLIARRFFMFLLGFTFYLAYSTL